MPHFIRQGDLAPVLECVFARKGQAIDFTTYTGLAFCAEDSSGALAMSGGMVTGESDGRIFYEFMSGDTAVCGQALSAT